MAKKNILIAAFAVVAILAGLLSYSRFWVSESTQKEGSPSQNQTQSQTVELFYYDQQKDTDYSGNILCSRQGVVPVERQIPLTSTPIQDTINLLLKGQLTQQEKDEGVSTQFPLPGFSLRGASLENGVLTLEFNDPNNASSGGSCRAGILWFQIEATALQFPQVQQVKFSPDTLFQP